MSDQVHNIFVDMKTKVYPTMTVIDTEELNILMRTRSEYEALSNYTQPVRVRKLKAGRKLK